MTASVRLQKNEEMLITATPRLSTINYAEVKATTGDMVNIAPFIQTTTLLLKFLCAIFLLHIRLEKLTEILSFISVDYDKELIQLRTEDGLKSNMIPFLRLFTSSELKGMKYDNFFALMSSSAFLGRV